MTTTNRLHLDDPLPRRFITDGDPIDGVIKARPEDFIVDELPLYHPCGEGEHVYLCVQKSGVSHGEMLQIIARAAGVREAEIGAAGMKDKIGVTRQVVSIRTPRDPDSIEIPDQRVQVLWADRHRNKLKRGHLAGNRFSIRIRDTNPLLAPQVHRRVQRLMAVGVPNFFGYQRFGYRRNTHLLGALLLTADHQGLLDELLGAAGSSFPEHQRRRREDYDAGEYLEARRQWSASDRAEVRALDALIDQASPEEACGVIGRTSRNFWINAFQSAVFNRVLDQRIELGLFDQLEVGDLAWKHDSRSVFRVDAEEFASGRLEPRLANFEISPSGPLWGRSMTEAEDRPQARERAALDATGVTLDDLARFTSKADGARRALRVPLRNPEIDASMDEHGASIRVAFDLPRGAYATVVLRELLHRDEIEAE